MASINIGDIQPGMVLAGDVTARNGRVLMRAGGTISEKHLEIFKAWGVTEADIEGVTREDLAAAAAEKVDPEVYERIEEEVRHRFRHNEADHPFIAELRRICTSHLLDRIAGEER